MCAIAGITGGVNSDHLYEMIKAIRHRGPDYQGVDIKDGVGLAHARLSIIDLSEEGNQPMWDSQKTIAIVFNGEIYNYLSLRKPLEKKYNFKSKSDTEVLLYLYKEYGKDMLQKIEGMFTFAIYDFNKQELFIAKDRMGKKPLYYSELGGSFIFASELKSLLTHPLISKNLNLEGLNQYLTFDYVPTPNTLISNVFKLEAAHYLIVKESKIVEKKRYWQHNYNLQNISVSEAIHKFDCLLSESVKCRLMSDVPLGVFLSGGIDSSAVAYYAQKNSTDKIKTFSIGFEEKSYDESGYAELVARHIGSEHYSEVLTPGKALSLIEEIYPLIDEPFADASLIPTYFLSQITRKQVTVALGGDGSDELLAGYPTFISDKLKNPIYATRDFSLRLAKILSKVLPVRDRNISLDFKISQFLRGFTSDKNHIHQLWLGSFLPHEKSKLLRENVWQGKGGMELVDSVFKKSSSEIDLNQIIYYYCQTYLHDNILVKVDRASMLNSLEVRTPFLDRTVVEFVNSLPSKYKLNGLTGKVLLKKLMKGKIPNKIIYRPKKGFGVPLSGWLRKDLKKLCDDYFSRDYLSKQGIFNFAYVQQIRGEHDNFQKNNRKLIWNLLMLQIYLEHNNLSV